MALSLYERKIRQNRRELLTLDARARDDLERAYVQARQQMQRDVQAATGQLARMEPAAMFDQRGRFTDAGQVQFRIERLTALEQQVDAELARLQAISEQVILQGQRQAAQMGLTQANGLIEAAAPQLTGSFATLSVGAVESIVGQTSAGSPLRDLLNAHGRQAAEAARDVLTNAIAIGTGPREVARELSRVLNRSLWQAETVARTELLRAHRQASLETYQQNSGVVRAYRRIASKSSRTCGLCLALDGTIYELDRLMPVHPNDRCSMAPVLHDRFGNPPIGETGAEWFARQPADVQRLVLGPAKQALYESGQIRLGDLVGIRNDKTWGPTTYEKPLGKLKLRQPVASIGSGAMPGAA